MTVVGSAIATTGTKADDAPGHIQASTSRRLSVGSKLRLPPTPIRVTPKGKESGHLVSWDCVRKVELRTQLWAFSTTEARCAKSRYE